MHLSAAQICLKVPKKAKWEIGQWQGIPSVVLNLSKR